MESRIKVLVTGAGGFIGHHLMRYLTKKGYQVYGADLVESKYMLPEDCDTFYIGDLTNAQWCNHITEKMDYVYNLAALNGSIEFTTNNRAELVHNNALINLNMAEACYLNNVKKVFYASSACVYPINLQDSDHVYSLEEADAYPANCDTEYGWEKLFSERVYQDYAKDRHMNIRIARFINVYGPECLIDTLMSKAPMALTRKVIEAGEGGSVKIWGDGKQKRTFCYIDDLLKGIDLLMESDVMEPVNIGSDNLFSINNLVDLICSVEGVQCVKIHEMDRVQGVRTRTPNLDLIHQIGWKEEGDLVGGLAIVNDFVHKELSK